jgi:phosphoglycerate dehydrogenase-like enzyme
MITAKVFELINPNAVIINTARGPVIEEKALLTALQSWKL